MLTHKNELSTSKIAPIKSSKPRKFIKNGEFLKKNLEKMAVSPSKNHFFDKAHVVCKIEFLKFHVNKNCFLPT